LVNLVKNNSFTLCSDDEKNTNKDWNFLNHQLDVFVHWFDHCENN